MYKVNLVEMARMHSRKKGKSGSNKLRGQPLDFVKYKKEEIKELILNMGKKNTPAAKIGLILRDKYGVPDVKAILGESITDILKKEKLYKTPEDLENLKAKAKNIEKHMEKNKKDLNSKRHLGLTKAKIRRLVKYYTKNGVNIQK